MPADAASAEAATPSTEPDRAEALERTWRDPVVLIPAAAVAVACVIRYEAEAHGFISGLAGATMVVLAATDLRARLIPNRIVLPAAAVVLAAQLIFYSDRAGEWILSALGAALFLFLPTVIRRGAVGMGDVKLALLMGAALGTAVVSALIIGFLAMLPVAIYVLVREGAGARESYLPLAPFLAFGAIAVLLAGGAT